MIFLSKFLEKSVFVFALAAVATGVVTAQNQRARYDVTNYKIDAALTPANNRLTSTVDVTFTPLDAARSFVFELNGSLKVESVTRVSGGAIAAAPQTSPVPLTLPGKKPARVAATTAINAKEIAVSFVQDQVGVSDLGPNVRIDFTENVAVNVPVTLRFKYAGNLVTPEGGPLQTKKLAFVSNELSYLMYAARWFPFHEYAADRATAEIFVTAPAGTSVIGYSDEPVTQSNNRYRFVHNKPALIGNFAAGKFRQQTLRFGTYEIQFNVQPQYENRVNEYAEILGKALQFYQTKFGATDFGSKYVVAAIDDESLDTYSAPGMLFLSQKFFENPPQNTAERLEREAAFQWWGQTVGLKSFDEAWLSQGLAEYSALELRESRANATELEGINRELLERALTFEPTASLVRAPATLDDQMAAFQYIMFYKGSAVFRLLRETIGRDKFNNLLRSHLNQYRGKNASIDEFEKLTSSVAGDNLRYFFARWVEGTGVPEFTSDYQIIRTRAGKFIARGTVKQNYDNLRLPVEVQLRAEGGSGKIETVRIEDTSEDFNLESNGKPIEVVIDPNFKLLRIDDDLRVSAIARRGIEQFKEGNYVEAQQQFEAALKLNRSNSWVYYHLGLLFLEQRNYDLAIDNFKATLNGNLRPSWLQVWANVQMGKSYDAKGDRTRAVASYKRAQDLGNDYNGAQEEAKKYLAAPFDPKAKETTAVK